MSKQMLAIVAALLLVGVNFGCTASVRPGMSESEFFSDGAKSPSHVIFVCSDTLRTYVSKQGDPGDMRSWKLELGPASADAFRYHLAADIEKVDPVIATPGYPLKSDVKAVIVPTITEVKSRMPVMFKFETYHVTVTFAVDVYDASGTKAYSRTYVGKGSQKGSVGQESAGHAALPEASRKAILQAVEAAVHDLAAYLRTGTVPPAPQQAA